MKLGRPLKGPLVIKTLELDWIRILIGIQPKMMDPVPYQIFVCDPVEKSGRRFCLPFLKILSNLDLANHKKAGKRLTIFFYFCRHGSIKVSFCFV